MSKAKDLAKQYMDFREQRGIKNLVMLDEIDEAYYEGYHQAEKDLELTREDIRDILSIYEEVIEMDFCEDDYGEVLKRFKDLKNGTTK